MTLKRYDIQHNDTYLYYTEHNGTQLNNIKMQPCHKAIDAYAECLETLSNTKPVSKQMPGTNTLAYFASHSVKLKKVYSTDTS